MHDAVEVGRVLRARGPRNNFPLVPSKRYRFVVGGIGPIPGDRRGGAGRCGVDADG